MYNGKVIRLNLILEHWFQTICIVQFTVDISHNQSRAKKMR